MSQDALCFINTLHLLFLATILLALTDAGCTRALWPDPPGSARSGLWLVRCSVVSVYAWSGIAKLQSNWLHGEALDALFARVVSEGASQRCCWARRSCDTAPPG
jgi:hypothetical protein